MAPWTFITNHGAVLALIAERGQITGREIAQALGITERSVRRIIADLVEAGYILKGRTGRTNHYKVNREMPLRRADWRHIAVGELLRLWLGPREIGDGLRGGPPPARGGLAFPKNLQGVE